MVCFVALTSFFLGERRFHNNGKHTDTHTASDCSDSQIALNRWARAAGSPGPVALKLVEGVVRQVYRKLVSQPGHALHQCVNVVIGTASWIVCRVKSLVGMVLGVDLGVFGVELGALSGCGENDVNDLGIGRLVGYEGRDEAYEDVVVVDEHGDDAEHTGRCVEGARLAGERGAVEGHL